MPTRTRLVLIVLVVACACKSRAAEPREAPDAGGPTPSASAAELGADAAAPLPLPDVPVPEIAESAEPDVSTPLAVAVQRVAADPLLHEDYRLLVDGVSPERVVLLLDRRLARATPAALACAKERTAAALAALVVANHPPPSLADAGKALAALGRAVERAMAERKLADTKCADGG